MAHELESPATADSVLNSFIATSDETFLYPYDDRMCYFDAVIEEF